MKIMQVLLSFMVAATSLIAVGQYPTRADSVYPVAAGAFVDSWGVDTHFNYLDTPYGTYAGTELSALVALGIHHIRDGGAHPSATYMATLKKLCAQGIRHSVGFNSDATTDLITTTIDEYDPSCVDFVEPQNEFDATKTPNWPLLIEDEQKLLFATIKGTARFRHVAVLAPALANLSHYALLSNLDEYSDAQNMHDSPCDGNPETKSYRTLSSRVALLRSSGAAKPIWTTETSYSDATLSSGLPQASHCGLPDDVIARYIPRSQLVRFALGQPRIYWYAFSDQPKDTKFGAQGFVDQYGRPKPQYLAVKALLNEISDGNSLPVVREPIAYTFTGAPADFRSQLLEKADGTYDLIVWRETPSWDVVNHIPISVATAQVGLQLSSRPRSVYQLSYDSNWSLRRHAVSQSSSGIVFNVNDEVSIIKIRL